MPADQNNINVKKSAVSVSVARETWELVPGESPLAIDEISQQNVDTSTISGKPKKSNRSPLPLKSEDKLVILFSNAYKEEAIKKEIDAYSRLCKWMLESPLPQEIVLMPSAQLQALNIGFDEKKGSDRQLLNRNAKSSEKLTEKGATLRPLLFSKLEEQFFSQGEKEQLDIKANKEIFENIINDLYKNCDREHSLFFHSTSKHTFKRAFDITLKTYVTKRLEEEGIDSQYYDTTLLGNETEDDKAKLEKVERRKESALKCLKAELPILIFALGSICNRAIYLGDMRGNLAVLWLYAHFIVSKETHRLLPTWWKVPDDFRMLPIRVDYGNNPVPRLRGGVDKNAPQNFDKKKNDGKKSKHQRSAHPSPPDAVAPPQLEKANPAPVATAVPPSVGHRPPTPPSPDTERLLKEENLRLKDELLEVRKVALELALEQKRALEAKVRELSNRPTASSDSVRARTQSGGLLSAPAKTSQAPENVLPALEISPNNSPRPDSSIASTPTSLPPSSDVSRASTANPSPQIAAAVIGQRQPESPLNLKATEVKQPSVPSEAAMVARQRATLVPPRLSASAEPKTAKTTAPGRVLGSG